VISICNVQFGEIEGYGKYCALFGRKDQTQYIGAPRRCKVPADGSSAREIVGSSR
jgi:hypothetical protein